VSDEKNYWGRKIGSAAIWVVAFVVAYVVVYTFRTWSTEDRAVRGAENTFKEVQTAAAKNNPELSPAEGMHREAVKRSTAKIESQSGDQQANTAADMFWGFFFVNTRSRPQFCKELGMDISPFVEEFQRMHSAEFAKAHSIYKRDSKITSDELYVKLEPQLRKTVEIDMDSIAKREKLSILDICGIFATHGALIAKEMPLSKMQPAVHKALMASR
jgi:hypothetical protein